MRAVIAPPRLIMKPHKKSRHRRDDRGGFFVCMVSDDGVINRSLITHFPCFSFSCVYTARHADGLDIQSVYVPRE